MTPDSSRVRKAHRKTENSTSQEIFNDIFMPA